MVSSSTEPKSGPALSSSSHSATLPGTAKGTTTTPLGEPSGWRIDSGSSSRIGSRVTKRGLSTLNTELASSTERTRSVRVEPQRLRFAQVEQSGNVIDVGVGQHHCLDWAVPQTFARMEERVVADLLAQIRRGVAEHPVGAVRAQRDGGLGPRPRGRITAASPTAVRVVAVPLGIAAARAGPQHSDLHGRRLYRLGNDLPEMIVQGSTLRRQTDVEGPNDDC